MKKTIVFNDDVALNTAASPVIQPSWSGATPATGTVAPTIPVGTSAMKSRAGIHEPEEKIIAAAEEAYKQGVIDAKKDLQKEIKDEVKKELQMQQPQQQSGQQTKGKQQHTNKNDDQAQRQQSTPSSQQKSSSEESGVDDSQEAEDTSKSSGQKLNSSEISNQDSESLQKQNKASVEDNQEASSSNDSDQETESSEEKMSEENSGENDQELPHKDSKIVHLETDPALKKMEKEGEKAGVKEEAKLATQTQHKLEVVMNRHEKILLKCKTLFPFDFFPDTLLIDTLKITIIRKSFFATEHITTIPLKDLADVFVQTSLFIASLTIEYRPQSSRPTSVLQSSTVSMYNLRREDAIKAKDILKGVLVASEESIDPTKMNVDEAAKVIEKLGNSSSAL